ncbi:MAG: CotH kinase family protein [Synergistaceae bacterium]|nr:CotH kinase family protein [Synergistaceae bacterium]
MLSVAGNDYYNNDGTVNKKKQAPPAYETAFSAVQSKKNAVRRVKFRDTDDNSADTEAANYSAADVSSILPHSLAFGAWDENTMLLTEINALRKRTPKFYETYCTSDTVSTLSGLLAEIDTASGNGDTDSLVRLKSQLEAALKNVAYKSDSKIAQVYVATDKGDGTSYGTSLTKAIGYVPAQMVVVGTDGGVMAEDLSWAGQIKVRGNSTASKPKKPYNMKFSSKVDIFGFGKARKWTLLADYLDPTLMRNKTALDLAEILGLDSTMAHRHVEVWVDGKYRGMYLLTEKIEEDKNRVNIDIDNGDFMIETVVAGEEEAGNIYFTVASGQKFRLREPEPETSADIDEAVQRVSADVDGFEKVIASGNWDKIAASLDVESFVSYYVLNEYMKTYDIGHPKSVYFHTRNGKYYAGPAWDFDWTSGNHGSNTSAQNLFMDNKIYYKYLVKHLEFQLKVSEKLSEISGSLLLLNSSVKSYTKYYSDAIGRNNSVWTVAKTVPSWVRVPDATYESNLTFFTDWLASRYDWMTDYFLSRTYISSDTFPDPALLAQVRAFDTNTDSFLSTAEKAAVTSLDLSGLGLTSLNLVGLEVFPNLSSLDITGNPSLAQVNVHSFPNLNITYDESSTVLIERLPSFSGHSLVLSGQIGVDFYVDIPDDVITSGAYADFTINGITGNPQMLDNAEKVSGNTYMFTCYINSVQMADTITATFHYGNDTVTDECSAKDYLDTAIAKAAPESADLVALVKAIKDYGHYVQKPLADFNGWEYGVKHAVMDFADGNIDSDIDEVTATLAGHVASRDTDETGIESVMLQLELNSETALNIYLYPASDYTGTVNAYLDGSNQNMAVLQRDGSYRITISGISAHMLADVYTVHAEAGKSFDIKASALSYADLVMRLSDDTDLKKAVIALYKYYIANVNYRDSTGY